MNLKDALLTGLATVSATLAVGGIGRDVVLADRIAPRLQESFEQHEQRLGLDVEYGARLGPFLTIGERNKGYLGFYDAESELIRLTRTPSQHDIDHETAHHLIDRYVEEHGLDTYVWKNRETARIVNEGIARYLEGEPVTPLEDAVQTVGITRPYEIGLSLVAPIIQMHGKTGLEYLLRNEPDGPDLSSLQSYQFEAIKHLEAISSPSLRRP